MMDTKKIEKYIQLLKKHDLHEMEIESEGDRVRITAAGGVFAQAAVPMGMAASGPAPSAEPSIGAADVGGSSQNQIRSPFVGTFYESATPGAEPFVKAGQKIRKGETLCIIEAMKIMNEIEAERDCTIKEILVGNGQAVEYDQAIFSFE